MRDAAPKVLAELLRKTQDFAAAEDATQEALLAALTQWPVAGVPTNRVGWLVRVAQRRLIDESRSASARRQREALSVASEVAGAAPVDHDDSLALFFMCCHPSLSDASAVALTLRAVGGLRTEQIASAFLVAPSAMSQRISRAKATVSASGEAFGMPAPHQHRDRLRLVLHVLYLIFNEGYLASEGAQLARDELSGEAIRLTRKVAAAQPDEPEAAGLLALMLLNEARRPARSTASGDLIALADQDRTSWNSSMLAEGLALMDPSAAPESLGPYGLQAAIAAVHARAPNIESTDWAQILALYERLESLSDNPLVSLNKAVAVSVVRGPQAALDLIEQLRSKLGDNHRLAAIEAHLQERLGDVETAASGYRRAAAATASLPEQRYLLKQAARLDSRAES